MEKLIEPSLGELEGKWVYDVMGRLKSVTFRYKHHKVPEEIYTITAMSLCDAKRHCHGEDSHTQDRTHGPWYISLC